MELLESTHCFARHYDKSGRIIGEIIVNIDHKTGKGVVFENETGLSTTTAGESCLPKPIKSWKRVARALFNTMNNMQSGWLLVGDTTQKNDVEQL